MQPVLHVARTTPHEPEVRGDGALEEARRMTGLV